MVVKGVVVIQVQGTRQSDSVLSTPYTSGDNGPAGWLPPASRHAWSWGLVVAIRDGTVLCPRNDIAVSVSMGEAVIPMVGTPIGDRSGLHVKTWSRPLSYLVLVGQRAVPTPECDAEPAGSPNCDQSRSIWLSQPPHSHQSVPVGPSPIDSQTARQPGGWKLTNTPPM
jgi:hypothetical protein